MNRKYARYLLRVLAVTGFLVFGAASWKQAAFAGVNRQAASISLCVDKQINSPIENDVLKAWVGDEAPPADFCRRVNERYCWNIPSTGNARYLYIFCKDPVLRSGLLSHVRIDLLVLDTPGTIYVQYNSEFEAFKEVLVSKSGTKKWKTISIDLSDALFRGGLRGWAQDGHFRLLSNQPLAIAEVKVNLVKRHESEPKYPTLSETQSLDRLTPDHIGFSFGGMHWGANGLTPEIFEKEVGLAAGLGFGWIRQFHEWAQLEPNQKGDFNHWADQDLKLDLTEKYGISSVGAIQYSASWAADIPDGGPVEGHNPTKYPPRDLQDLADYTYTVVSRYKGRIKYWEFWNEANAESFWHVPQSGRDRFEHYVAAQRVMYEAAKRADPGCVVLTGGFASVIPFPSELINYYKNGLKGTFDVMNIHIYWAPEGIDAFAGGYIESVLRVMEKYGDGDKKIWITETGYPVENSHAYSITLDQQAKYFVKTFTSMLRYPQVEKVFFHELRDRSHDAKYGLYDSGFNPRPVVEAWQSFRDKRHTTP